MYENGGYFSAENSSDKLGGRGISLPIPICRYTLRNLLGCLVQICNLKERNLFTQCKMLVMIDLVVLIMIVSH